MAAHWGGTMWDGGKQGDHGGTRMAPVGRQGSERLCNLQQWMKLQKMRKVTYPGEGIRCSNCLYCSWNACNKEIRKKMSITTQPVVTTTANMSFKL